MPRAYRDVEWGWCQVAGSSSNTLGSGFDGLQGHRQQGEAGLGDYHLASVSLEQGLAEFGFQLADALSESGGGDSHDPRSRTKVQVVRRFDEAAQGFDVW
jgi:hypothetical protein